MKFVIFFAATATARRGTRFPPYPWGVYGNYTAPSGFTAPSEVDFRSRMPPIKDQGQCGGCWAFSAVDAMDFYGHGSHSEQQVIDCTTSRNPKGGCQGGWPISGLRYLQEHGTELESSYPYTDHDWVKTSNPHACRTDPSKVSEYATDVKQVIGEDNVAAAAATQVVSFSISCCSEEFENYKPQEGDADAIWDGDCTDPQNPTGKVLAACVHVR